MKNFAKFFLTASLFFLFGCGQEQLTISELIQSTENSVDTSAPVNISQDSEKPVVILEKFSDFSCIYCRRAISVLDGLKNTFGSQLDIRFRHLPRYANSLLAHQASECAREQEKFNIFYREVFDQQVFSSSELKNLAKNLGLDEAKYEMCMDSGHTRAIVEKDKQYGLDSGARGTPFFLINGKLAISGLYPESVLQDIIQQVIDL